MEERKKDGGLVADLFGVFSQCERRREVTPEELVHSKAMWPPSPHRKQRVFMSASS